MATGSNRLSPSAKSSTSTSNSTPSPEKVRKCELIYSAEGYDNCDRTIFEQYFKQDLKKLLNKFSKDELTTIIVGLVNAGMDFEHEQLELPDGEPMVDLTERANKTAGVKAYSHLSDSDIEKLYTTMMQKYPEL